MSNLLQRLFRSDRSGQTQAPGEISRSHAAALSQGPGQVDVFFLWDHQSPLDRQLLLLSIDALAHFARSAGVLQVEVVHREAVDASVVPLFDAVPGLACRHRTLAGSVAPDHERAMAHRWREFAALAVARLSRSPFYLVLDDSAVCVRPLLTSQLVHGNKALTQWEPLLLHPDALAASNQLLRTDVKRGQGISTLPAVMSVDLVAHVFKLLARDGVNGDERLAEVSAADVLWTANSLYSVACQAELTRHHLQQEELGHFASLHGDANLWDDDADLKGWDPVRWVGSAVHGQFIVVKSLSAERARSVASGCYALLR